MGIFDNGLFQREDVRDTATAEVLSSDNFNASDFSFLAGVLSLKNKTSYLSIDGAQFHPRNPDADDITYKDGGMFLTGAGLAVDCPVNLPHGAVITEVIVYGNAGAEDETWALNSRDFEGNDTLEASNSVNTADTTINNPIVDNANKSYVLQIAGMSASDIIYGARIKYTTDYD